MRQESAIFKCDICEKVENYTPKESMITYPVPNWFFQRKLEWNEHYSVTLDVCNECFQSTFVNDESKKQKAVSLVKRFFGKKS